MRLTTRSIQQPSRRIVHRHVAATAAVALAILGLGACGGSDEDEIRAATREFQRVMRHHDGARSCALMTPRAKAQTITLLATFSRGGGSCEQVLDKTKLDEQASDDDLDKATITSRGDRAQVTYRGEFYQPIGLRKVAGRWLVDNMLNPNLDEKPRRSEPELTKGSDARQIRATLATASRALAAKDLERACDLLSDAGEAQILMGGALVVFGDPKASETPSFTCAKALGRLASLPGLEGLEGLAPPAAKLAAADVTIRGDHATVRTPGEARTAMLRVDDRWLIDADRGSRSVKPEAPRDPTAAQLARCWKASGAQIATDASDLRFAVGDSVRAISVYPGRISVKGPDWRIFYSLPSSGDPGVEKILSTPSAVRAVAYVTHAARKTAIVARARKCGE